MRNSRGWVLSLLVAGCSMLSVGCVDALVDGVARGVNNGLQSVVEDLVLAMANAFLPGE